MKAVCALLCLALAQGISAAIFKRSHHPLGGLIMQPLAYSNQYEQQFYQPQGLNYQEQIQEYMRSHKEQQQQKNKKGQQSTSTSHESSQESKEKTSNEQYITVRSGQKWATPLFTAIMKVQNDLDASPYAKNIVWSSDLVQMPVLRKKDETPTIAEQQQFQKIFAEAQQAMKHLTAEEKVQFQQAFTAAAETHKEDEYLNATDLLLKNQYPVEEHTVKTEDGFNLTLFRIPPREQNIREVTKKPVVFLMHGLLGNAEDWLVMGPGKSLAYLLSDAGYDVWLGNARGNKYSRYHVSKHRALDDYWEFGTELLALLDLPAMIDYVLEKSDQEKLHYVGYSQGTTLFFAMASFRPEYNDKIITMHALAPMVYMKHTLSPLMRMIAPDSPFEERLQQEIGQGQFKPSKALIDFVGGSMLQKEIGYENVTSNVNFVIAGVNVVHLSTAVAPVIKHHAPTGASTRVIKQYGQQVASDEFRKYDFGPKINKEVYGSVEAEKYQVENVKAPVWLYYAEEDWLAQPTDVAKLQETLPNAAAAYKVPEKHFSHMDFQFSTKAPELVYKQLIEAMNKESDRDSHSQRQWKRQKEWNRIYSLDTATTTASTTTSTTTAR